MVENHTIHSPHTQPLLGAGHKAVLGLALLLLHRLPPRLTTRDVAAGKAQ